MSVVLWLVTGVPAWAIRRCGDDVDGKRVPCRCGDLLVSSRTLGERDRITRDVCPGGGLMVDAAGPVTLALGGHTVRGSGQSAGVLVLRGTLTITGPGGIERFHTGLMARGPAALASAVGLRVAENRHAGIAIDAAGYAIQGCVAEHNGGDGFMLGGSAYALDGNRAVGNGRYGFNLMGMGAHAGGGLGNEAIGNMMTGFFVRGFLHQIVGATATENMGDGVFASVHHTLLADVRADRNQHDGVQAMGMLLAVADSSAADNRGFGIWVNAPDVQDGGGNRGAGNAGLTGRATAVSVVVREKMGPLVQCRIGMAGACR